MPTMFGSAARRIVPIGLRIVDALHLRWALRWVYGHLQPGGRMWVGRLQVRLGFMEGLLKVPEADLVKSMEASLRLLGEPARTPSAAYLEFGVYVGTSMACMYRAASSAGADLLRLIGFDSFQGMPSGEERDPVWTWQPGQLYSDIDLTNANLERLGVPLSRVELVAGWFEESLTDATRDRLGIERAAVIMFDCILASSTRAALDFCTPLIRDRSVLYFDDWSAANLADRGLGERRAFDAWLADHPEMMAEERPDLGYGWDSQAFLVTRTGRPNEPVQPDWTIRLPGDSSDPTRLEVW